MCNRVEQDRDFDVLIIGAGVCGSAIARELSRKELKIAVLEKETDICEGTSKANSGIVHAGYDAKPGTLKAKLNVQGSRMMKKLSEELDFAYRKNGAMVLCMDEKDKEKLEELKQRGITNGVEKLQILDRQQILNMEPSVNPEVVSALYAPSSAVVCPFELTIALAENAAVNGAEFFLSTEVTDVIKEGKGFCVKTSKGDFYTKAVINAAGVYADKIHNMVSGKADRISITPRKGEYLLYDKAVGNMVSSTLFQLPTALGKGILVTPTVHGNLITGPTAQDCEDKDVTPTSQEGIAQIQKKALQSIANVPSGQVITSFAGLRAHGESGDFMIGQVTGVPGFFDVAGIESPGLSCAPAIGVYVADLVNEYMPSADKADFIAERKGIPHMANLPTEEKQRLILHNPAYGNVICRCEMVTEGEILDAIHRPLGATTTDGVKRRTRAGMGRCQSGFCLPKVIEILARELKVEETHICKASEDSFYLLEEDSQLSLEGGEEI